MASINKNKLEIIKLLYESGKSVSDIAETYKLSIDAVYYFFRKYKIKRRNYSEARATYNLRKKPSFKIKTNLLIAEKELKVSGIMLYWGEGSKWEGEKIVDFANSDEGMINVFLNFLRKICGINESKLRIYLYCYANQNQDELINYWSKLTKVPVAQFTKPFVKQDFKQNKEGKMKHGLIHIRYADKKLLNQIRAWIDEYKIKLI